MKLALFIGGVITLGYETNPLYGFSLGSEFKGNVKLGEKNRGDYVYGAPFQNEALLSQGFINYGITDILNLRVGRQPPFPLTHNYNLLN